MAGDFRDNALMPPDDTDWMRRALALAEGGRGLVEPNPLVGAVLVRDGKLVGEGFHQRYGEAHAEVNALFAAGEAARGANLYCTLEPCCHHGKTPPCTGAIVRAGVARVVVALRDPFPEVGGRGIEALRAAGVEVHAGVLEDAARAQNAPYLKLLETGLPWVIAKWAMSLDGKIADRAGESKWITGAQARERVHQLRGRMDAILVGIGTVLADDPLLTARPPGPRLPFRVVLDSRLRLPLNSKLVHSSGEAPVVVYHGPNVADETRRRVEEKGCECVPTALRDGRLDLLAVLKDLGRQRLTNVLVEGGDTVLGSLFDADAVDEVYAFVAPLLLGGPGPGPLAGKGKRLAHARRLDHWTVEQIGDDVLLHGRIGNA